MPRDRTSRIRALNDQLRTTFTGGMIVLTRGVEALPDGERFFVVLSVTQFDDFNENNDPHQEHDCAVMTVGTRRIMWKIDTYDRSKTAMSPDAADPDVTVRVLTIMLAEEY